MADAPNNTHSARGLQWRVLAASGRVMTLLGSRKAPSRTPLDFLVLPSSGGAGIRTPVRDSIHHDVYVRSPPVKVSDRWPVDSPLSDKSTEDSLPARRHRRQLARICDTCRAASGGLPGRQVRTPKRYAARAKLSLAVVKLPRGLTRIREPGHAATASLDPSKPVAP
jgi:hypothetical protein